MRFGHKPLISILVAALVSACAQGTITVTGEKRPAIKPKEVELYSEPPAEYEVIGLVKASSGSGFTQQGSQDYAVEELKEQAASVGANGVLLKGTGEESGAMVGTGAGGTMMIVPTSKQKVTGRAIYITEEE